PDLARLPTRRSSDLIRSAVSEQLDQRGLRKAQAGNDADLRVQVWLIVEQRTQQYTTTSMGAWGSPWHGYWGGPMYTDTRTLHYQDRKSTRLNSSHVK